MSHPKGSTEPIPPAYGAPPGYPPTQATYPQAYPPPGGSLQYPQYTGYGPPPNRVQPYGQPQAQEMRMTLNNNTVYVTEQRVQKRNNDKELCACLLAMCCLCCLLN